MHLKEAAAQIRSWAMFGEHRWILQLASRQSETHAVYLPFWQLELPALAQKFQRVLVNHIVHVLGAPAAALHFERRVRDIERDAHAPVARAVQPEPFAAEIGRASCRERV